MQRTKAKNKKNKLSKAMCAFATLYDSKNTVVLARDSEFKCNECPRLWSVIEEWEQYPRDKFEMSMHECTCKKVFACTFCMTLEQFQTNHEESCLEKQKNEDNDEMEVEEENMDGGNNSESQYE